VAEVGAIKVLIPAVRSLHWYSAFVACIDLLFDDERAGEDGLPCFILASVHVVEPACGSCQLQVVPLTANDAGTAFVVLFQLPLNPMPE